MNRFLSSHYYDYDAARRRTAATRFGSAYGPLEGATDVYGYNARSEVVQARRMVGDEVIRGFNFDYAYDPIGNRVTSTYYDEQGGARTSAYSANELNQYTQRTVPGNVQVRGEADADATVTVNGNPAWRYPDFGGPAAQASAAQPPQPRREAAPASPRSGTNFGGSAAYFYGGDDADNDGFPVFKDVAVEAVIPAPEPGLPDEIAAVTGRVFVAASPEQFTYDADGNMTSDGRFRYTWNAENRLVLAQELCAPSNRFPYTVSYAYDHKGRMVSKRITENDGNDSLVSSVSYLWDGWNIIREIQWPVASGLLPVVTDNVWGLDLDGTLQGAGGVGGLLAVVKSDSATNNSPLATGNWQLFLPTYDANGNITEYVTTNGEVVAHYDYSPFGETLIESGELASSFTHRFSTKPWCPVTGLYEYQMRKYRPEIGRWMSRDMLMEIKFHSHNNLTIKHFHKFCYQLYLMCCNNTTSSIDVLGFGEYGILGPFVNGRIKISKDCEDVEVRGLDMDNAKVYEVTESTSRLVDIDFIEFNGVWYKISWHTVEIVLDTNKKDCSCKMDVNLRAATTDELEDIKSKLNNPGAK